MIEAYLVGIPTHYENEDIEIRYRIYKDQELVCEKTIFQGYEKPLVVSHVALLKVLDELRKYKGQEITIMINDAALNEQIRGTSQTKNKDVRNMARKVKENLDKFNETVIVRDVSRDPAELKKWDEILQR